MNYLILRALAYGAVLWIGYTVAAGAARLDAMVKDDGGNMLEDAVVTAMAVNGAPAGKPTREGVDQIDREFVPYLKALYVGSSVSFPNKDNIRHHVYSFSPAKHFDLPLHEGKMAGTVVFDKPGIVTLGCNIHDWMIAYLYVADTPYFGKTSAAGKVDLNNLSPGSYVIRVWHPRMTVSEDSTAQRINIGQGTSAEVFWRLKLKPDVRPPRAPSLGKVYR
jgi:plastocyanin